MFKNGQNVQTISRITEHVFLIHSFYANLQRDLFYIRKSTFEVTVFQLHYQYFKITDEQFILRKEKGKTMTGDK